MVRSWWESLCSSLWFTPALIVLAGVGLAVILVEVDARLDRAWLEERRPRLFGVGAEGARGLLAAVAGSMITVAGVTFSITVVAFPLASSQYTSRVLRNFMRDRGDVIALSFTQTTIMEMGQPPPVQNAEPSIWVQSRQYTGRVVTVSNAKIFDEPVYNYTRDFPYLWEEMSVPIPYAADRRTAERILVEAAERHSVAIGRLSQEVLIELQRRYATRRADVKPKVYYRLTDNWLELTVRFVVRDHGVRDVKDAVSRDILEAFDEAGIGLASATFEIVGLPPLHLENGARDERLTAPGAGKGRTR